MPKNIRRELDRLRLPDLQQRYRAVVGEETRCPNRTFLIRRIADALEARASSAEDVPPLPASSSAVTTTATSDSGHASDLGDEPARAESPVSAPLPAIAKRGRAAPRADRARARAQRGRFKSMTVEELQVAYLSIVGRPTGSTDRRYLVWKIREAEKGRVPVGPRDSRTPDQQASTDTRILPLRLDAPSVAAIDATWRAQGLKSLMDFFRRAPGHYLAHVGAHGAAAMFATP